MILRLLTLLAIALALQACDRTASTSYTVDDPKSGGSAAIVIGLGIQPDVAGPPKGMSISFAAYDPATDKLHYMMPDVTVRRSHCFFSGISVTPDCDIRRMQRFVLAVPPGEYAIVSHVSSGVGINGQRYIKTTRFVKELPSLTVREVPTNNARLARWRVAAGEVVYVGDFVYDPFAFPAKLQRIERHDAGAAEALADYKHLHGKVAFRLPIIGRASRAVDLNAVRATFDGGTAAPKE
jgi:hypothetical protein